MYTLKLKYTCECNEDIQLLKNYISQFTSVYHVAFNNYQNKKTNKNLSKLNNIQLLDSWFIQCANYEAKFLYNKIGNKKIIFGGRKNYINRQNKLITKEEYKQNRYIPLCSYGEKKSGTKAVHGNRKFKLSDDLSHITLKLKNKKIKLYLPEKIHHNYKTNLKQIYMHQILDDCPITYKIDLNYIYITVNETDIYNNSVNIIQNRVMSIDMNPNYIGWTIIDWKSESEFNIIKSGLISIKQLNDKELKLKGFSSESKERKYITNKRNYETIQIVKNLINKAIYYKCQIFSIEDLNIESNDSGNGKRFNKLVNNLWNRTSFINNLEKRCNIFGIKLLKVKPEYSSFIGNFLFRSLNLPDPVLSSIEISRRGYEFYNQYVIKVKNIKKNIIQPEINQFKHLYIKSLEEFGLQDNQLDFIKLYYVFKKSKMMYRLSIDQFNLQFSSLFSKKSKIINIQVKRII